MTIKIFNNKELSLQETIIRLYRLKDESLLLEDETMHTYDIDYKYELAVDNIDGSIPEVEQHVTAFSTRPGIGADEDTLA